MSKSEAYLHEYIGSRALASAGVFVAIVTICVTLRLFTKWLKRMLWSWDDIFMILAYFSFLGLCSVTIVMVTHAGVGHHIQSLSLSQEVLLSKLEIVFTIVYIIAITFPKMAIICLLLKIFVKKIHFYICYALIAVLGANFIALTLVTCFECVPLSSLWDPNVTGKCIDITAFWRWSTLSNIITDVIMLCLPMPIIWQIQISMKNRVGLLLTLCTGGIGLITSVLRSTIFFENTAGGDASWSASKLSIYSMAEPTSYIIAACLPIFRSLYIELRSRYSNRNKSILGSGNIRRSNHSGVSGIPLASIPSKYTNLEDFSTSGTQVAIVKADFKTSDERLTHLHNIESGLMGGPSYVKTPGIYITREVQISK